MSNPTRTAGKRGRLPRDPHRYVPTLEHYLRPWEGPVVSQQSLPPGFLTTGLLPPATGDVDRETQVSDWPMYINGPDPANPSYAPSGLGDCTIAGICHAFSAMAVYAGFPEPSFTSDAIVTAYSACGGYVPGDQGTDQGCDMATVLAYMTQAGIPDDTGKVHKVAGYAAFGDPQNETLLAQTLAATGTVYLGSDIQQSQETQFADGEPWEWNPGEQPVGGHCYVLQRRRVGGIGVLEMITWAAVQRATRQFQWNAGGSAGGGEAFFVASEDFVRANGSTLQGLDLEQLMADSTDVE